MCTVLGYLYWVIYGKKVISYPFPLCVLRNPPTLIQKFKSQRSNYYKTLPYMTELYAYYQYARLPVSGKKTKEYINKKLFSQNDHNLIQLNVPERFIDSNMRQ